MENPKSQSTMIKQTNVSKLDEWYKDTSEQVKKIREVGVLLYHDPNQIKYYFSLLINLFSTHSSYIDNEDEIGTKLDVLKKQIYSIEFTKTLNRNRDGKPIYEVIDKLMKIFTHINKSFSNCGVSPKVTEVKKEVRR